MLHVYNDIILPCDGMGLLGYLWERKLFHLGASSVANAEGREKAVACHVLLSPLVNAGWDRTFEI